MRKNTICVLCLLASMGLFGCSDTINEADSESEPLDDTQNIYETETNDIEEENTTENPQDADNQIKLISDNFDSIKNELVNDFYGFEYCFVAVTDLNRNNRLELTVSTCQGSGALSMTAIYEVSEDYKSLERMKFEEEYVDIVADFSEYDELECYKKDGSYYYVGQDYSSFGWDYKSMVFFSYRIDDKVTKNRICGYILLADSDEENVRHVSLFKDGESELLDEESYYEMIEKYWSDYEKMPTCTISWQKFPLYKDDVLPTLQTSYAGFDTNTSNTETDYDYRRFFGDDVQYIIDKDE